MLRHWGVSLIQEDSCNLRASSICCLFVKDVKDLYFDVVNWVAVSEMSLEKALSIVVFNFLEMFVDSL